MTTTPTLHLVRHAESAWNLERRYQGHGDSDLTAAGMEHADALAEWLLDDVGERARLVASDLRRARSTAAALATRVGAEVGLDARFREIDVGTWSGRAFADVAAEHPDILAALAAGRDVARGDGETFAQVRRRVGAAMDELARQAVDRPGADLAAGGATVVFTHAGAIRVGTAGALGVPSPGHDRLGPPAHCSVTSFELIDGRWRLARYNRDVAPPRLGDAA